MANEWKKKISEKLVSSINNKTIATIIVVLFGLSPTLFEIFLWVCLDPVGFWQKAVMIIFYCVILFPVQFITGIIAICALDEIYN